MFDIIIPVLRLLGLTVAGVLLFRIGSVRRRVFAPLVFVTLNILFPLFFITNFSLNWEGAAGAGPLWLVASALLCLFMMLFQAGFGRVLVGTRLGIPTDHPREVIALSAVHNAGYIPIPILTAIVPGPILIYQFFYTLGFNLIFWTLAVDYISGSSHSPIVKLNPPSVGILLGLIIAVFGWYEYIPAPVRGGMEIAGTAGVNLVLVVLGGVLVQVYGESTVDRTLWWRFVAWRQLVYPAAILAALIMLSPLYLDALPEGLRFAVPFAIVLQACVPPSTNLAIVTEAYGTRQQTEVVGRGVIVSYLAALFTIPLFLALATLAFA